MMLAQVAVPSLQELLGPLGLTVVLLVAGAYVGRAIVKFFWQLWQLHLDSDANERKTNEVLLATLPEMSDSIDKLLKELS